MSTAQRQRELRRVVILVLSLVGLFGLSFACDRRPMVGTEQPVPSADGKANVILIVVDTLRKDHLGIYGHHRPTSRNIDRLAAESLRFDRAISQAPWTTPSMGALLTSRYPTTLGIKERESIVPEEHRLLSEILLENGYSTGAVVSHDLCSAKWGFAQGVQEFDESNAKGHHAVTSAEVTDLAIDFATRHQSEPFFLWIHYFDPHFVYVEHPDFRFAAETTYEGVIRSGVSFATLLSMEKLLKPKDVAQLLRLYDSELAHTDRHIGRFLDRLRELGLYGSSLIILTADHGEEFLDHGSLGHSKTLYEELIAVPLLMKFPGVAPGVVERPVALLDIYPTVLDWLGIAADGEMAGKSILPGRRIEEERAIFSETERRFPTRSVTLGDYKFILQRQSGRRTLYNLATDPGERRDLTREEPEVAARLFLLLHDWSEELRTIETEPAEVELSEEEITRLEALGYTE